MATLIRVYYSRPVPPDATPATLKGRPAVRFANARGETVVALLTKDGKRCRIPAADWYGQYTDETGQVRRAKLSPNKAAAQQMLAEVVRKVERRKAGLTDPLTEHRSRPLADHLAEWEGALKATDATARHVRQTTAQAHRVVRGCGFVFLGDLSASAVSRWLADMRATRPSPAIPDGEWFTRNQVAAVLGVKPSAVPSLVARHRLTAAGNGKARRYPRSTVEALAVDRGRGLSAKAANQYLAAVRQFARWLVRDRRLADDPLAHLAGTDPELDRRRERRFLTADEVQRLVAAARASGIVFRGLGGADRAVLYAVAVCTGLRAGELVALAPESFDLDAVTPVVRLPPAKTKNRKGAVLPLPRDLTEWLRGYLAGRPSGRSVWPGTWYQKAAEMIRTDLEAAGIPFAVPGPDGRPLAADFHALRHTCGVLAERGGATLREVMALMRHSDPKLTLRTYGRLRTHDLAAAVEKLPPFVQATGSEPR